MSVTFSIPQAPVIRVQPYDEEPDYFGQEPADPFSGMNVSNSNAVALMRLVEPSFITDEGVLGEWTSDDFPRIRSSIMRALNTRAKEAAYVDPAYTQEPGRCRVYHGGRDASYVQERLNRLLSIVTVAAEHGFTVSIG